MFWKVIAIVYGIMPLPDQPNVLVMQSESFKTKEVCKEYIKNEKGIVDDILKIYPTQTSSSIVCVNNIELNQIILDYKQRHKKI